jgi:hypothetical protein
VVSISQQAWIAPIPQYPSGCFRFLIRDIFETIDIDNYARS